VLERKGEREREQQSLPLSTAIWDY